jgi:hypothetical protein
VTRDGRGFIFAALGLLIGCTLCAVLLVVDNAGAQETTTTTTEVTTTTEPTTTTTTVAPPAPPAGPTDEANPIGSVESLQWLALLLAFTCGHVLTR